MFAPKPDANMLRPLVAMSRDQAINTFLDNWLKEVQDALVHSRDPIAIHQMQGSIKTLNELITLMRMAERELRQINKQ
jgi:hypothetical protein